MRSIPASKPIADPDPVKTSYVPRDFEVHGYTPVCRGCEFLEAGLGRRQNHNMECRTKIEELLENTEDGDEQIREAGERKTRWMDRQIADHDKLEKDVP